MPPPPRVTTTEDCECGDSMRWQSYGLFRERWRLECICGRCGPWRSQPETRLAGQQHIISAAPETPPFGPANGTFQETSEAS